MEDDWTTWDLTPPSTTHSYSNQTPTQFSHTYKSPVPVSFQKELPFVEGRDSGGTGENGELPIHPVFRVLVSSVLPRYLSLLQQPPRSPVVPDPRRVVTPVVWTVARPILQNKTSTESEDPRPPTRQARETPTPGTLGCRSLETLFSGVLTPG